MASKLQSKIDSLLPELSFEFNEAYSLNPTLTGSAWTAYTPRLIKSGSNLITYQPTVGPIGGAGSWYMPNDSSLTGGNQIRTSGTSMNSMTWIDGDYSTGVWIMVSNIPDFNGDYVLWRMGPNSSSVGFAVSLNVSATGVRFKTDLYNGSTGVLFGPTNITVNKWYYIAIRKTTSGTNTTQIYLDGVLVASGTNNLSSTNTNYLQFGITTALGNWAFNFSNWYVAPYASIGATQIADIWTAGSTLRTIKYFDGSNWQTSSAQKVWNGTAWIDWTAKKYDGSQWIST